ncbi:MAG: hypothetical protein L6Q76_13645, partial [Polyangiaceae bacterium]|nr:hypothetical protein [Polyangiaceae bacterium]
LESATLDPDNNNKPRKLSASIRAALDDVIEDREALQEVLGSAPAAEPERKEADRREDAAIGALYDLLRAWARVAGEIPEGDIAARLLAHLKEEEGLSFINWPLEREWSAVETRLQIIAREKLEPELEKLGAAPILKHLRAVHKHYGEIAGTTKAAAPAEPANVRERRDILLDSIRHYVGAVAGSVMRKQPETRNLANLLLKPLTEWKSRSPRKRRGRDEEEASGGGSTTG